MQHDRRRDVLDSGRLDSTLLDYFSKLNAKLESLKAGNGDVDDKKA